jgi:uncharacterized protein YcaQ
MPPLMTLKQLSQVTLQKHFLIDQAPPGDIIKVIGRVCGLNAQTARGPYISLWNRIKGFNREHLTKALYEERSLMKAWLMRNTVHMVPVRDFAIYQKALRQSLCKEWERVLKKQTLVKLPRNQSKIRETIAEVLGEAPSTKQELLPRVSHLLKGYQDSERKRLIGWALRALTYQGIVCHADSTGTWYHFKDNRFSLVSDWLDPRCLEDMDEEEAQIQLLLKYLGGYGPATIHDFAYWSGLKITQAKKILELARDDLAEVVVKDAKGPYWALKAELESIFPLRTARRLPTRFLPEFDPLIMGHRDKARILDEEHRGKVFLRLADVAPTVLANGRIAGTWSYSFTDGILDLSLFGKPEAVPAKRLRSVSQRLTSFLKE